MTQNATTRGLAALQRLARREFHGAESVRCELCSLAIPVEHPHLLELADRLLRCVCSACAMLFDGQEPAGYRQVRPLALRLEGFEVTETQWEDLGIPIGLAFFVISSRTGKVSSFYPSPGGATESLLDLHAWNDIRTSHSALEGMKPDVEALLAYRIERLPVDGGRISDPQYYLVSIDECYRLVGLIRSHWQGISGGTEVWHKIDEYFADLGTRSGSPKEVTGA